MIRDEYSFECISEEEESVGASANEADGFETRVGENSQDQEIVKESPELRKDQESEEGEAKKVYLFKSHEKNCLCSSKEASSELKQKPNERSPTSKISSRIPKKAGPSNKSINMAMKQERKNTDVIKSKIKPFDVKSYEVGTQERSREEEPAIKKPKNTKPVRIRKESGSSEDIPSDINSIASQDEIETFESRLKKGVLPMKKFVDLLTNFDIEIYFNFKPEKCLFREIFMRMEVFGRGGAQKGKTPGKAGPGENAQQGEGAEANKEVNVLDEDAMLNKVLLRADKEQDENMPKEGLLQQGSQKGAAGGTEEVIQEIYKKKTKKQKEMTAKEIKTTFMMQGVLINLFIKAIKIDIVTKYAFVGALVRTVQNINKHLLPDGGFFSLIINMTNGDNLSLYLDEEEGMFKTKLYSNELLTLIRDSSFKPNQQYVIRDILAANTTEEAQKAVALYRSLKQMSVDSDHNYFRFLQPENSIWLSHFLKIQNLNVDKVEKMQTFSKLQSGINNNFMSNRRLRTNPRFSKGFSGLNPPVNNPQNQISGPSSSLLNASSNRIASITFFSVHQLFSQFEEEGEEKAKASQSQQARSEERSQSMYQPVRLSSSPLHQTVLFSAYRGQGEPSVPSPKALESVYAQISVFLNHFQQFGQFTGLLADRLSLQGPGGQGTNKRLFSKLAEAISHFKT